MKIGLKKLLIISILGSSGVVGTTTLLTQIKTKTTEVTTVNEPVEPKAETTTTNDLDSTLDKDIFSSEQLDSKPSEDLASKADADKSDQPQTSSVHLLGTEKQVRYIALGDSISAGFTALLPQDYQGELRDGKVSGLSFPAFLAKFIQTAAPEALASFENLSRSSSRLLEWNTILKNDFGSLTPKQLAELQTHFQTTDLNALRVNLLAKLQSANLITITLGANDVIDYLISKLSDLPLSQLFGQILNNSLNISQLVGIVSQFFQDAINSIKANQIEFINNLKTINPTANINFISYPLPLAQLSQMMNSFLANKINLPFEVSSVLISLLNTNIAAVAKDNGVNFLNVYDETYWKEHLDQLTPMLFDIHPSFYGYKKMAMDIFVKLTRKEASTQALNEHQWNFSANYLTDTTFYVRQLDFEQADNELYDRVFGTDKTQFLFTNDDLIKAHLNEVSRDNYYTRVINEDRFLNIILDESILLGLQNNFFRELDPDGLLYDFLTKNNLAHFREFKTWAREQNFFTTILRDAETAFFATDWNQDGTVDKADQKFQNLITAFKNAVLDETRNVSLIKNLLQIPFLSNESTRAEFKHILDVMLTNFLGSEKWLRQSVNLFTELLNTYNLGKFITKNDFATVATKLLTHPTFKDAIVEFVDLIFGQPQLFAENVTTYRDLFVSFFSNQKIQAKLTSSLSTIITDFLKDDELKPVFARVAAKLVLQNFKFDLDEVKFTQLLNYGIAGFSKVSKNLNLVETFFSSFFKSLGQTREFNFNFTKILENAFVQVQSIFTPTNIKQSILTFIKVLLSNENVSLYQSELKTFFLQLINSEKFYLNQKLVTAIGNLLSSQLNLSAQVQTEVKNVLAQFTKAPVFADLVESILAQVFAQDAAAYLNVTSFSQLIKVIFTNIEKNPAFFTKLNELAQWVLKQPTIQNLLTQALNDNRITKFISFETVKTLLADLLNSPETHNLVSNFVQNALNDNDEENLNYVSLLRNWFKNADNNTFISSYLASLVQIFLHKPTVKTAVVNIVTDLFPQSLSQNLEADRLHKFFAAFYDQVLIFNNEFDFSTTFIQDLIAELAQNPDAAQLNIITLLTTIAQKLFSDEKLSRQIFTIAQQLLSAETLREFAPEYKQFLVNLLTSATSPVAKILAGKLSEVAIRTFNLDVENTAPLQNSLRKLLTTNEFLDLTFVVVDQIFALTPEQISQTKDFNELIKLILQGMSHNDALFESANKLVQIALNDDTIAQLVLATIKKSVPLLATQIDLPFIKELSSLVFSSQAFREILDELIQSAFASTADGNQQLTFLVILKNWATNNNTEALSAKVKTFVTELINSDVVKNKVVDFITSEISDNLLANVEPARAKALFSALYNLAYQLQDQPEWNLINKFIDRLVVAIQNNDGSFNFVTYLQNFIQSEFSNFSAEGKLISILQSLLGSQELKNFKPEIAQILINAFQMPNGLFKNLLLDTLGAKIATVLKIKDLAALKNALSVLYNSKEFERVITLVVEQIFKWDARSLAQKNNLSELIALIFSDLGDNSELFSAIANLLEKAVTQDIFKTWIETKLSSLIPELGNKLDATFFVNLVRVAFKSPAFRTLVSDFLNVGLTASRDARLADKFNLISVLKNWIKAPQVRTRLAQTLQQLTTDLLENQDTWITIRNIIKSYIPAYLTEDIAPIRLNSLLNDLKTAFVEFQHNLNIIGDLVNQVLEAFVTQDNFSVVDFLTNYFKAQFRFADTNKLLVSALQKLLSDSNIRKYTPEFKTIILNLLTHPTSPVVAQLQQIFSSLNNNNVLTTQQTNELLNEILNLDSAHELIVALLNQMFLPENNQSYDSLTELFKATLSDLETNEALFTKLKTFVSDVSELPNFVLLMQDKLGFLAERVTSQSVYSLVKALTKQLLVSKNFRILLSHFVQNAFVTDTAAKLDLSKYFDFAALLKTWFTTPQAKEFISNNAQALILSFFNDNSENQELVTAVTNLATEYLTSSTNTSLTFLRQTNIQSFLKALYLEIPNLVADFGLITNFTPAFIEAFLAIPQNQTFDFKAFIVDFFAKNLVFVDANKKLNQTTLKTLLIKVLGNSRLYVERDGLAALLTQILSDQNSILTQQASKYLQRVLALDDQSTKTLTTNLVQSQAFRAFVQTAVDVLFSKDISQISNATNLVELFGHIFSENQTAWRQLTSFAGELAHIIVSEPTIKAHITNLITNLATKNNVEIDQKLFLHIIDAFFASESLQELLQALITDAMNYQKDSPTVNVYTFIKDFLVKNRRKISSILDKLIVDDLLLNKNVKQSILTTVNSLVKEWMKFGVFTVNFDQFLKDVYSSIVTTIANFGLSNKVANLFIHNFTELGSFANFDFTKIITTVTNDFVDSNIYYFLADLVANIFKNQSLQTANSKAVLSQIMLNLFANSSSPFQQKFVGQLAELATTNSFGYIDTADIFRYWDNLTHTDEFSNLLNALIEAGFNSANEFEETYKHYNLSDIIIRILDKAEVHNATTSFLNRTINYILAQKPITNTISQSLSQLLPHFSGNFFQKTFLNILIYALNSQQGNELLTNFLRNIFIRESNTNFVKNFNFANLASSWLFREKTSLAPLVKQLLHSTLDNLVNTLPNEISISSLPSQLINSLNKTQIYANFQLLLSLANDFLKQTQLLDNFVDEFFAWNESQNLNNNLEIQLSFSDFVANFASRYLSGDVLNQHIFTLTKSLLVNDQVNKVLAGGRGYKLDQMLTNVLLYLVNYRDKVGTKLTDTFTNWFGAQQVQKLGLDSNTLSKFYSDLMQNQATSKFILSFVSLVFNKTANNNAEIKTKILAAQNWWELFELLTDDSPTALRTETNFWTSLLNFVQAQPINSELVHKVIDHILVTQVPDLARFFDADLIFKVIKNLGVADLTKLSHNLFVFRNKAVAYHTAKDTEISISTIILDWIEHNLGLKQAPYATDLPALTANLINFTKKLFADTTILTNLVPKLYQLIPLAHKLSPEQENRMQNTFVYILQAALGTYQKASGEVEQLPAVFLLANIRDLIQGNFDFDKFVTRTYQVEVQLAHSSNTETAVTSQSFAQKFENWLSTIIAAFFDASSPNAADAQTKATFVLAILTKLDSKLAELALKPIATFFAPDKENISYDLILWRELLLQESAHKLFSAFFQTKPSVVATPTSVFNLALMLKNFVFAKTDTLFAAFKNVLDEYAAKLIFTRWYDSQVAHLHSAFNRYIDANTALTIVKDFFSTDTKVARTVIAHFKSTLTRNLQMFVPVTYAEQEPANTKFTFDFRPLFLAHNQQGQNSSALF
ncbi:SGNH/GDSL hydrolase family protein [Mycoplasmopsis columbinasalis]|uniref:Uncharacterized protein n=1 Tax=Mycoplasmopsis columbinasalis TaxID=114880 RepID=A0A449B9F6_9BACT|nr:SGNH/GDSL hydrolase family protein [Mycoplasmopsis columbinasalis]VEU77794.1 Uncharacterised protein [Mycoplasmopsis columbinasalis]